MIMYAVVGTRDDGSVQPEQGRVYVDEDGAYAALGRIVTKCLELGDLRVQEVQVVGQLGRDAIEAPATLEEMPTPWSVSPSNNIVDANKRVVVPVSGVRSTGDQDKEMAAWLVALVNREVGS